MPYVALQQLKDRLGTPIYTRLTDRVGGVTPSDAVGQQVLDEAVALVDSRLARRYATPVDLAAHPELADVLEARVLDVAEFVAWRGSPFVGDVPDRVQTTYDDALRWLEAVATGQADLPAASPPASRLAADDSPRASSSPRRFTDEELDGL